MQDDITISEKKKEIEMTLARTLLSELEKGSINYENAQEAARQILVLAHKANTQQDLDNMIPELVKNWPLFQETAHVEEVKSKEHSEKSQQLEDIRNKLLQFTHTSA